MTTQPFGNTILIRSVTVKHSKISAILILLRAIQTVYACVRTVFVSSIGLADMYNAICFNVSILCIK